MSRRETEINHEEHEDEIFFVLREFRALRGGNYLFSPGNVDI
jgi:hypothetical protein